jgi:hypothetical protein
MATSCIVDDYVNRKRQSLLFTEQNFLPVVASWKRDDNLLRDLQGIDLFKGLTRWEQLDPMHFRVLITNALNTRDKAIPIAQHFDDSNQVVAGVYFLLMGLIYTIQCRTGAAVDALRITRISAMDVTFGFTLTMMAEEKKAPPKSGLQVIVDNTDK